MLVLSEDRSPFKCLQARARAHTHTRRHSPAFLLKTLFGPVTAEWLVSCECDGSVALTRWLTAAACISTHRFDGHWHLSHQMSPPPDTLSGTFGCKVVFFKILGLVDATLPGFGVRRNEHQTCKGRIAFNLWPLYFPKIHQRRAAYSFFLLSHLLASLSLWQCTSGTSALSVRLSNCYYRHLELSWMGIRSRHRNEQSKNSHSLDDVPLKDD